MSSQFATLRPRPRLSLNQLARYSTASAPERDQIVRSARERVPPPLIYYREAEGAIATFLISRDERDVRQAIAKVMAEHPRSEQAAHRRDAQITALHAVLQAPVPTIDGLSRSYGDRRPARLMVEGVELSIRPEVMLSWTSAAREHVGAIKLLFAKADPIGERNAALSLSVLVHFLELNGESRVVPSRCFLFDVFAKKFHAAPKPSSKRWKEVESCCREIAWRWQAVEGT